MTGIDGEYTDAWLKQTQYEEVTFSDAFPLGKQYDYDVDAGRRTIMRSVTGYQQEAAPHIKQSELCASCHTLITKAFGPDGSVIATGTTTGTTAAMRWDGSAWTACISGSANTTRTIHALVTLADGDVVVATDYQGLGAGRMHPYLVGASEAHAMIDAVRAARHLPPTGLGSCAGCGFHRR